MYCKIGFFYRVSVQRWSCGTPICLFLDSNKNPNLPSFFIETFQVSTSSTVNPLYKNKRHEMGYWSSRGMCAHTQKRFDQDTGPVNCACLFSESLCRISSVSESRRSYLVTMRISHDPVESQYFYITASRNVRCYHQTNLLSPASVTDSSSKC